MSMRGIVMSYDHTSAVVMLPGGDFRRVTLRGQTVRIGQEWEISDRQRWRVPRTWLAIPALVAASLLAFVGIGPASVQAAAVISIDINPSVNLAVSGQGKVIRESGLDRAGSHLLKQQPVIGLAIARAVSDLVQQANEDGYFSTHKTVVIGAVFKAGRQRWFGSVAQAAGAALQHDHVVASLVTVSGVSSALVTNMQKPQVSVGRYLLWRESPASERDRLTTDQVKNMPIAQLLEKSKPRSGAERTKKGAEAPRSSQPEKSLPQLPVSTPSLAIQPLTDTRPPGPQLSRHSTKHQAPVSALPSVTLPLPSLGGLIPSLSLVPSNQNAGGSEGSSGQRAHRHLDGQHPSQPVPPSSSDVAPHRHLRHHRDRSESGTPPSISTSQNSQSVSNPVHTVVSLLNNPPLL